jgi:hypothetical protein
VLGLNFYTTELDFEQEDWVRLAAEPWQRTLVRSHRGKPCHLFKTRGLGGEMTAMCAQESNDKNIPFQTDAYYEEQARQEEIYLEETEEVLRMILESDDPSLAQSESPNQQRVYAAEELLMGDSDDPPLCEEAVEEMLRMS